MIHLESLQGTEPPRPGGFCISKNASITRPPRGARRLRTGIVPRLVRGGLGLAYLGFVTIHPFDDGNGRIAHAIADTALARSENSLQRLYSASARIRHERNTYYDILEFTQKGTVDITSWIEWFLGCLGRTIDGVRKP